MALYHHNRHAKHAPRLHQGTAALPGEVPAVKYMDSSTLDEPQVHGVKHWPLIGICTLLAVAVSGFGIFKAYDKIVIEPQEQLQRTIDALDATVDYNLPSLLSVINLSDSEMEAALLAEGNTLVILEPYAEDPSESEGFDLYRIPNTLTEKLGTTYLNTGISSLKDPEAATILNGAWRYTVYRYLACAVRLQYANFEVNSPRDAIKSAMEAQGWLTPEAEAALDVNFPEMLSVGASTGEEGLVEEETVDTEGEGAGETTNEPASTPGTSLEEPGATSLPVTVTMGEYGQDSNGNTYQSGTIVSAGRAYEFKISTVTVEEMYELGLPREGMFIGIRLTQLIME